ncbi:hypothetical protein HYH03_000382 [Edaphochlamys debaryana]|uniref:3-beta hydroxysteroid dehydrogenase/isomerase domain-containing protein n=1 Tax=Edaphochlamys debaryana TaxID=47281 RepID=A0A835YHH3_9CHLO|nr:hypothetical protein HYH03_000382 [Edaphochlamys debaryana]|eukprot:KAG2501884.1 hypothetical protein HYH03_000382 [Edaphochlamys debaryana]
MDADAWVAGGGAVAALRKPASAAAGKPAASCLAGPAFANSALEAGPVGDSLDAVSYELPPDTSKGPSAPATPSATVPHPLPLAPSPLPSPPPSPPVPLASASTGPMHSNGREFAPPSLPVEACVASAAVPSTSRCASPGGVRCLVTGGCGYVGLRLARALVAEGHEVILFDRCPPAVPLPPGCRLALGDLRSPTHVAAACAGAHSVFHLASYGMSGAESLRTDLIRQINVGGTATLLAAAAAAGARRLVHVSSYNAVWRRERVRGGTEATASYLPFEQYPDEYSRTKAQSERMVLEANGSPANAVRTAPASPSHRTADDDEQLVESSSACGPDSSSSCSVSSPVLRTCAVRPPGIYGPGELRHTPRILSYAKAGLLRFRFGPVDARTDWIHVDNLVSALLAAWRGLGASARHVAAGQAYFVSDGTPIATFDFWAPLLRGLGYTPPRTALPLHLIAAGAYAAEAAHAAAALAAARAGPALGRGAWALERAVAALEPWLTVMEVYKTGVEHWYRPDKACRELGWQPVQYDFADVIQSYMQYATPALLQAQHKLQNPAQAAVASAVAAGITAAAAEAPSVSVGRSSLLAAWLVGLGGASQQADRRGRLRSRGPRRGPSPSSSFSGSEDAAGSLPSRSLTATSLASGSSGRPSSDLGEGCAAGLEDAAASEDGAEGLSGEVGVSMTGSVKGGVSAAVLRRRLRGASGTASAVGGEERGAHALTGGAVGVGGGWGWEGCVAVPVRAALALVVLAVLVVLLGGMAQKSGQLLV